MKYITYSGHNEVLVTTEGDEADFLVEYFLNSDRDKEDYDREQTQDVCVSITTKFEIW